jgi:signal transduction histidine kinase
MHELDATPIPPLRRLGSLATGGKIGVMPQLRVPARIGESARRHAATVDRLAPTVAALLAMVVVVYTLAHERDLSPRWPLSFTAAVVGLGFLIAPAARARRHRIPARTAHGVAAVATIAVLIYALSHGGYFSAHWPDAVLCGLLGLGLAAGPVTRLLAGQDADRAAQTIAELLAMGVIVFGLEHEQFLSPGWPLTLPAVLLGASFVARSAAGGLRRPPLRAATQTAGLAAALAVVLDALARGEYLTPRWPLPALAAILGLGLAAGPIVEALHRQVASRSAEVVAAVAAMLASIAALSVWYISPAWPLAIVTFLLAGGFVLAPVARAAGREVPPRSAQITAVGGALLVVIYTLAHDQVFSPGWPLPVLGAILGVGLSARPVARLTGGDREEVLSERVAQLARTRSGALDVQANELRRIERDLHDGAQARLVALSMKLGRAEDRYRDDPDTAALLREAREDAAAAIRELRELARGIAPPVLADRGLEAAVLSLAQRSGSEVSVTGSLTRRPRPAVETAAYFVVAESLTNAAKHAPGARVEVRLDAYGGDLVVEVTDFGPGGADAAGGGLTGLRQRVEALDGALHVTSPTGVGTQIEMVLPCGW